MESAGAQQFLWRHLWPMLCWSPVPQDTRMLTMRWWPYWCHFLQVAQASRCPALKWCLPFLCDTSHALQRVYACQSDVAKAPLYRIPKFHSWFRLWCRGQLIGVLLSGNRLVMGTVQTILHTHTRDGWVRHVRLRGWGAVVYEQSQSHPAPQAHFRWSDGSRERVLAARALEPPRRVWRGVRSRDPAEYDA